MGRRCVLIRFQVEKVLKQIIKVALRDKSGFVAEYDLVCRVDVYVSFTCDRA